MTENEIDPYAEREASVPFNINVLRGLLHGTPLDDDVRAAGLTALDRIAAQTPQPTRVWMHRCGAVAIGDEVPPPCQVCGGPGAWDRLYTLGEAPDS